MISGKSASSDEQRLVRADLRRIALDKVKPTPRRRTRRRAPSTCRQLIDSNGKAIVFGGAPNLGFSIANGNSPFNPLVLVSGSWPKSGDVVIDQTTASKKHFAVGDRSACRPKARSRSSASRGSSSSGRRDARRRDARRLRRSRRRRSSSTSPVGSTRSRSRRSRGRASRRCSAKSGRSFRRPRRPAPATRRRRRTRRTRTRSSRSCATSCSPSAASPCSSAAS